jgi:hypothetical protein
MTSLWTSDLLTRPDEYRTVAVVGRIIGGIVGLVAIVNGLGILFDDECNSVSFGGQGGGRVVMATCFGDNSGVLPGSVAGLGVAAIGAAIAFLSVRRR